MSKHAFLKRISYTTTTGAGRYGTYKMAQTANGGAQHVAFTRILHRTQPDPLMIEVHAPPPPHPPLPSYNIACSPNIQDKVAVLHEYVAHFECTYTACVLSALVNTCTLQ